MIQMQVTPPALSTEKHVAVGIPSPTRRPRCQQSEERPGQPHRRFGSLCGSGTPGASKIVLFQYLRTSPGSDVKDSSSCGGNWDSGNQKSSVRSRLIYSLIYFVFQVGVAVWAGLATKLGIWHDIFCGRCSSARLRLPCLLQRMVERSGSEEERGVAGRNVAGPWLSEQGARRGTPAVVSPAGGS